MPRAERRRLSRPRKHDGGSLDYHPASLAAADVRRHCNARGARLASGQWMARVFGPERQFLHPHDQPRTGSSVHCQGHHSAADSPSVGSCLVLTSNAGASLKYTAALAGPRLVNASPAAQEQHAAVYQVLLQATALPLARRKLLVSVDDFMDRKRGHYKHRGRCIAWVTKQELRREPLSTVRQVFDGPRFLSFASKLDPSASSSGLRLQSDSKSKHAVRKRNLTATILPVMSSS